MLEIVKLPMFSLSEISSNTDPLKKALCLPCRFMNLEHTTPG